MSGGRDTGWGFWGNAEYTLNVDTGKAGLWPGGFLRVIGQSSFGESVLSDSGAISIVNTAAILPALKPDDPTSALLHATFMQFLSPQIGLVIGKFFTLDGFEGEFSGNYRTQFWNASISYPLAAMLAPFSAFGGGVVGLPWKNVVLSALVLDPSGTSTNNDVSEAFKDGVAVLAGGKVTIEPFGLVGHQSVNVFLSNKNHASLDQDPSNIARGLLSERFPLLNNPGPVLVRILERRFPELLVPVVPLNKKSDTWAVLYSFDQYLWQPAGDPKRGIGLFFTFGASDGDPNPVQYSYTAGVGGKGVIPGRPNDNFGVAWARLQLSDKLVPLLRDTLNLGLDHEDSVEIFYNASITPWLNVSLDLQVINPALQKTATSSGLKSVDTAVLGGLRMYIRF